MMRLLTLASLVLLTACTGNREIPLEHQVSLPPQEALYCSDRPEPPANSRKSVELWIVRMEAAWADCKGKVDTLRDYFDKLATQH